MGHPWSEPEKTAKEKKYKNSKKKHDQHLTRFHGWMQKKIYRIDFWYPKFKNSFVLFFLENRLKKIVDRTRLNIRKF